MQCISKCDVQVENFITSHFVISNDFLKILHSRNTINNDHTSLYPNTSPVTKQHEYLERNLG